MTTPELICLVLRTIGAAVLCFIVAVACGAVMGFTVGYDDTRKASGRDHERIRKSAVNSAGNLRKTTERSET